MSHVFPRSIAAPPPKAVSGRGMYVYDEDGKAYLDGSGGAAVSCLGHGDADIVQAIKDQLDALAFAHTGFFTSAPAETLAEKLIAHAPDGLDRVYFLAGGSEAMEAALKMARQVHLENGEPSRHRIIARKQSYHGNTLGALATGGNMWRREPFEPMLMAVSHIEPCYAYRHQHEGESDEAYGLRAAQALEDEILRLGPETVAAFVAETVVGATMGAVPAAPGYFKRIREICDRYGVLLILDEVMCGMGRTGHLYACEAEGISPDILCIAKGLGAGYQPIGATLCTAKIYDAFAQGSGSFQHGHTYNGHPTACAAGVAVLDKLIDGGVLARVAPLGERLADALQARLGQHPHIGDIRGRGLFMGLELVADRDTKAPFDPDLKLAPKVKKAAFAEGLICYPMPGTIDGRFGDHVLLAPPFIMDDGHIEALVEKLARAVQASLA